MWGSAFRVKTPYRGGDIWDYMGVVKEDTRSVDNGSYNFQCSMQSQIQQLFRLKAQDFSFKSGTWQLISKFPGNCFQRIL